MPYSVSHDTSTGILQLSIAGTVTRSELDRMFDEIERIEDSLQASPSRLADLRNVERFDADFSHVFPLAERRKKRVHSGSHRTAIVVVKPLHVGFARMYQTLNDNPGVKIELFTDPSEAAAWLGAGSATGKNRIADSTQI